MKKSYQKPEIHYESFLLSQSIATTCDVGAHYASEDSCAFYIEEIDMWIFSHGTDGCVYHNWDNICYHVPNGVISIFQS